MLFPSVYGACLDSEKAHLGISTGSQGTTRYGVVQKRNPHVTASDCTPRVYMLSLHYDANTNNALKPSANQKQ